MYTKFTNKKKTISLIFWIITQNEYEESPKKENKKKTFLLLFFQFLVSKCLLLCSFRFLLCCELCKEEKKENENDSSDELNWKDEMEEKGKKKKYFTGKKDNYENCYRLHTITTF